MSLAASIAQGDQIQSSPGHAQEGFLSLQAGFLPLQAPLAQLPPSHLAWDQLASTLPSVVEQGAVTASVQDLPPFGSSEAELPPEYLCRAASLLGILAHTCIREQETRLRLKVQTGSHLPEHLNQAWEVVCQRLGRPGAGMTYSDLILYNWRLKDPDQPRKVENLQLMIPVYGSPEERIFYMTMAEMHDVARRSLPALLSLEKCRKEKNRAGLDSALYELQACLQTMTYDSLLKIDPNPYSAHHVDQLVWAKTVAPFAFPIRPGELGLSGGGSPVFHCLDLLFQRKDYQSQIGQELLHLRNWMPPDLLAFLQAVEALQLPQFVQEYGSLSQQNLYRQTVEAYAGERGWLGLHRLKVYGFMEVGFKAGRTQTNGGFAGEVEQRSWEALDQSINASRLERKSAPPVGRCPFAHHKATAATPQPESPVKHVQLDLKDQGLSYQTGDRLGVFPLNSETLVAKTLQALNASGQEMIELNGVWRTAWSEIQPEAASPEKVLLKAFLARAKLRPLLRPVGKALYQLSRSPQLHEILERRSEDQYELWQIFELLKGENFDLRRLCKAKAWQPESLAKLIPPERFRVYSISSAGDLQTPAEDVHLTIGQLNYQSQTADPVQQYGTASQFLSSTPTEPIPVQVVRPSRFRLPTDPERPLVMFAGGTGISPFRGFWQSRQNSQLNQPDWLFLGIQSPEHLYYQTELESAVSKGQLQVRVAFSRSEMGLAWNPAAQQFAFEAGEKMRIQALMQTPGNAAALWQLLRPESEGGKGGYFYICGQTHFAHSVIASLKAILAKYLPGSPSPESDDVLDYFRKWVADGRLMMDIFTTFAPANSPGVKNYQVYDNSEVLIHNTPQNGYWMVIQGQVYDLSEFMYLHPGGERLIRTNAGLDATSSYEQVEHHLNSEVHAMLDLYKIGKIRRLDFGDKWGVAVVPHTHQRLETAAVAATGMVYLSLHDAYRHWMRYIYAVVESENALRNNLSLKQTALTAHDGSQYLNFIKASLLLEVQQLFLDNYLPQLTGPKLHFLWCITIGLCDAQAQVTHLQAELQSVEESPPAQRARKKIAQLSVYLDSAENLAESQMQLSQELAHLQRASLRFIQSLKLKLSGGLKAFEKHEQTVMEKGRQALMEALLSVPVLLERYYEDLSQEWEDL
jgi:sulfite reductase alpha subunit-like flavoprotein/cytochrome b involved in lipid metabolism